jgi:polyferredoxin
MTHAMKIVNLRKYRAPIVLLIAFNVLAIILWQLTKFYGYLFLFSYIGTSIGILGILSGYWPREKRPITRRISQLLIGLFLLIYIQFVLWENMQIEGFWLYLFSGIAGGATLHYAIAKIFGPFLFARGYCGNACWTAMVLDFLPYKRSPGRVSKWGRFRYIHFVISLALVILAFYVLGYRPWTPAGIAPAEFYWLLVGNVLYFTIGIGQAFYIKDNRAFCKYVCPITVFLKATSRMALIKINCRKDACIDCGRCDQVCPMDIQITEYIKKGTRVLSTECILCETCVNTCPTEALHVSFKLDIGGKEFIRDRETSGAL